MLRQLVAHVAHELAQRRAVVREPPPERSLVDVEQPGEAGRGCRRGKDQRVGRAAQDRGASVLDCPVSGSPGEARQGQLVLLLGEM